MAERNSKLDVWIVESNTVYKDVPFTVVIDWIQQGRLLESDQVKPAGSNDWAELGGLVDFQPYFPQPEVHRPQDQAEALGAVGLDVAVKRMPEEEDDDVDMIPLIDVSLVLLVFFMLTATSAVMASFVQTPETEHGLMADNPEALRIDIKNDGGTPVYSLGLGGSPPEQEEADLQTVAALLDRLKARLEKQAGVDLVINADKTLPAKVCLDLLVALRAEPFRTRISVNYYGVSGKPE